MRLTLLRLYFIALICFFSGRLAAQNGFSFTCNRDTILPGCSPNPCFTLRAYIPDIHGLSDSYTLNPIGSTPGSCFVPYVDPNSSGTPTALTIDDRYSTPLNIGFNFPFYGTIYNSLVVSTNGYVSFDASLSGAFSHYAILRNGGTLSATVGVPEDLPSLLYDRAIIMGPYHDLNPEVAQPTQRIQYMTVGTAPYRRWILSFYRVPLFGSGCGVFIENTHQIVLYESTGIIEVLLFSKQICNNWNQGRAMVGIQNFTRTQAVNVPGRRASDPPWGSVNYVICWEI
jgi:hypothetical protein